MKAYYKTPKTMLQYDIEHLIVYLNEEVVENYVPEEGDENQDPFTAYFYEGTEKDGGTIIEASESDRDSIINGIIRSKYSQTEEDAIKTHQIMLLLNSSISESAEYKKEWSDFQGWRDYAIQAADKFINKE